MKTVISTPAAPAALGPYSQAIASEALIFCSGQVALQPGSGELTGATVAEQTEQVLHNLGAVLRAAGVDFADVVKTTVFLTDLSLFGEMNTVYAGFFPDQPPARSTIQVSALPKGAMVEIEAVALKSAQRHAGPDPRVV